MNLLWCIGDDVAQWWLTASFMTENKSKKSKNKYMYLSNFINTTSAIYKSINLNYHGLNVYENINVNFAECKSKELSHSIQTVSLLQALLFSLFK